MNLIFLSMLLVTTFINGIITFLMTRHFARTRYKPSLILGLYFFCRALTNVCYFPIAWIDASAEDMILTAFLSAAIVSNFHILLLLMFFEAVLGKPLSLITIPGVGYYGFIICFLFSQDWTFTYSETNGWNPIYTPLQAFVLGGFMLTVFFIIMVRIMQSICTRKTSEKPIEIKLDSVNILPLNKLVVIWILGVIINRIGIQLSQNESFGYIGYVVSLIGILIIAVSYIYNPHAFFLSSAQIQSILFYDANNGVSLLGFGMDIDDNLAAGGLYGASSVQREIAGTQGYPTLQVIGDKVFLLAHEQVKNTHVVGTLIMNKYLPAMYPTLRHALHIFTTRNKESLDNWKGAGITDFDMVLPELLSVFDFAWSKERLAEIRRTMAFHIQK